MLGIFAEGNEGKVWEVNVQSPVLFGKYPSLEDWFVSIPGGKEGKGEIVVPVDRVTKLLLKSYPEVFGQDSPPMFTLQVIHKPHDRGEYYNYDAWTGELFSPLMALELSTW